MGDKGGTKSRHSLPCSCAVRRTLSIKRQNSLKRRARQVRCSGRWYKTFQLRCYPQAFLSILQPYFQKHYFIYFIFIFFFRMPIL